MPIASYSELTTELAAWLNRADLSARIPTFIRLFEARMNRLLRDPEMDATVTQPMVAGSATYSLPDDFRSARTVYIASNPRVMLEPMSPQALRAAYTDSENSDPLAYAIIGSAIVLAPTPAATGTLTMVYHREIPALTSTATTNWLLEDHPDAYLFGSLCMAEAYLKDDDRLAVWKSAWDEVVAEMQRDANRRRLPGGPLASRAAVIE